MGRVGYKLDKGPLRSTHENTKLDITLVSKITCSKQLNHLMVSAQIRVQRAMMHPVDHTVHIYPVIENYPEEPTYSDSDGRK